MQNEPSDQPIDVTQYTPPPQYPVYRYQQQAPQAPPPPQMVAVQQSTTPFWVWLLVGAGAMFIYNKFQEVRKNPLMAMAGMMGGMKPPAGGSSPAAGGDMSQMMEMMKQMQQQQQQQRSAQPNPATAPTGTPSSFNSTINVTASEVPTPEPQQPPQPATPQPATPQPAASQKPEAATSPPPSNSFFADTSKAASSPPPKTSFFSDSGSSTPTSGTDSGTARQNSESMVENMLLMIANNPEMQAEFAPRLPAEMQNPEIWQWIKNNPEIRKQLAAEVAPTIGEQIGDMPGFTKPGQPAPTSQQDAFQQLEDEGMDPQLMMSKVMADPELMALMAKPSVAAAVMDLQNNPNNTYKHMSDPDVATVMSKMMALRPEIMNKP